MCVRPIFLQVRLLFLLTAAVLLSCSHDLPTGIRLDADASISFLSRLDGSRTVHLVRMDLTDNSTKLIVSSPENGRGIRDVAWSETGGRYAFTMQGTPSRGMELWVAGHDGSGLRPFAGELFAAAGVDPDIGIEVESPSWSPNGSQLVCEMRVDTVRKMVVSINADGSNAAVLMTDSLNWSNLPVWSPDGTKIAYVRGGRLYTMNPDGSGKTMLHEHVGRAWTLAWSPDGQKIACLEGLDFYTNIYTINSDGSGYSALMNDSQYIKSFSWSPDGKYILTDEQSFDTSSTTIYLTNIDSVQKRALHTTTISLYTPRFSSDGRRILFSMDDGEGYDVFVMNADGSDLRRLTDRPGHQVFAIWTPLRR